jgi:GT2 family glycosyltransferase
MTVSVIIITLKRPDYVRRCLECLLAQTPLPDQIIIVDSSPDDLTKKVMADFPGVLYLRNETGFGRMTTSRNIGLKATTGEIIAFLDDDAFAHPGWLENLRATYTGSEIGAVGGRALNGVPGEATNGVDEIGQLKPYGDVTGNFAADPGKIVEVHHVMGCNMSFRREVIARLGGFREDYPGISGVCEDSDMCLRVRALGYKILFNPAACVDHVGAPQAHGKRFDFRYAYYGQHNRFVMLIRNFGLTSDKIWRYSLFSIKWSIRELVRRIVRMFSLFVETIAITGATLLGSFLGIIAGILLLRRTGRDPVRHDPSGQAIAAALGADMTKPDDTRPSDPLNRWDDVPDA